MLLCSGEEAAQGGCAEPESIEDLKDKLCGLEEQLATSKSELEELKEQMRLGVLSVECVDDTTTAGAATGGGSADGSQSQQAQQLRARVTELEEELVKKQHETVAQRSLDSDTIKQLTKKVDDLQAALAQNEAVKGDEGRIHSEEDTQTVKYLSEKVTELEAVLATSRTEGAIGGDGDQVRRLQERVGELEVELRKRVPRSDLEEVQVTLGLQCEQLARERADVARRLNDALLELERLRPTSPGDDEDEDAEHSESSEPSVMSGVKWNCFLNRFIEIFWIS